MCKQVEVYPLNFSEEKPRTVKDKEGLVKSYSDAECGSLEELARQYKVITGVRLDFE